ncbi:MAG TPA: hypothetical protein VGR91_15910, partial [Stellaceae bacterium]|nr:hypothetical protein [Stellaceae bacterium]
ALPQIVRLDEVAVAIDDLLARHRGSSHRSAFRDPSTIVPMRPALLPSGAPRKLDTGAAGLR